MPHQAFGCGEHRLAVAGVDVGRVGEKVDGEEEEEENGVESVV